VSLKSPLVRPHSVRDFMLFEEHVHNMAGEVPAEWSNLPVHWKGNPDQIFGPNDEIEWPSYTEKLDYELELGAVIGRRGRPRTAAEAEEFIVGYTIFNDWSARDIQLREMSVLLGPGIGKDFATSLGPVPLYSRRVRFRRGAYVCPRQWRAVVGGWDGADALQLPRGARLLGAGPRSSPGDVVGSGTVGRGCGMELDRWLAVGDVVELEVDGDRDSRHTIVEGGHVDG